MSFSKTLYELRTKKGLSQKQLADLAGVSQTAIYHWEKGERNPKFEALNKIADVLGVSINELMPDTDYNRVLGDKASTAYSVLLEQIIGVRGYTFGITEDDDSLYISYPDGILKVDLDIVNKLQEDIESFTDFKMQELKKKYFKNFIPKDKFDYKTKKCKYFPDQAPSDTDTKE